MKMHRLRQTIRNKSKPPKKIGYVKKNYRTCWQKFSLLLFYFILHWKVDCTLHVTLIWTTTEMWKYDMRIYRIVDDGKKWQTFQLSTWIYMRTQDFFLFLFSHRKPSLSLKTSLLPFPFAVRSEKRYEYFINKINIELDQTSSLQLLTAYVTFRFRDFFSLFFSNHSKNSCNDSIYAHLCCDGGIPGFQKKCLTSFFSVKNTVYGFYAAKLNSINSTRECFRNYALDLICLYTIFLHEWHTDGRLLPFFLKKEKTVMLINYKKYEIIMIIIITF